MGDRTQIDLLQVSSDRWSPHQQAAHSGGYFSAGRELGEMQSVT